METEKENRMKNHTMTGIARQKQRSGVFTLIELLVVIAIIFGKRVRTKSFLHQQSETDRTGERILFS